MGCSSSSAQAVDQEKRPGVKPEESNGDTAAVRNGIIAEDAQTIEDQLQLPVQTALPEDLQPGADDEAGAVLVALEAQEDLGFGEDLLAAPEPQPGPAVPEEPAPEAPASAIAEGSTEPEADAVVEEALPPVEDDAVEDDVKALAQATGEVTDDLVVQVEVPALVEDMPPVGAEEAPALEPVVSEPAEAAGVDEEVVTLSTEAPEEVAAPTEAPADNAAPGTASATPAESTEPSGEAAASGDSSASAEPAKAIIDTKIAAATIPEIQSLTPVTDEVQAEPQPAAEEPLETPAAPADTDPPAEAPSSTEATSALAPEAEPAVAELPQVVDAPAATTEPSADVAPETPPANVSSEPVVDITAPGDSEAPSVPAPAVDPALQPPLKVASTIETSQDPESEKSKKD